MTKPPTARTAPAVPPEVLQTAREVFGWEELRPGQGEAVAAVLAGRDALVVMPTGAGKSATYQLPGLHLPGPTLVVSPLLALQRDQAEGLGAHEGATRTVRGAVLNSDLGVRERAEVLADVREGRAEFLFLAPEQLGNDEVLEEVRALAPSLVAVDEAHCISSWGHDFRPDYLRLGAYLEALGGPPVIALTATAAPPVRDDIVERLGLRDPFVLVQGFARENIRLEVVRPQDGGEQREQVLLRAAASPKPQIVYVATRRDAEEVTGSLEELGLRSAAYHAGLRRSLREDVHTRFLDGGLDVVVATSAFGMGIDKPDVRSVVHAAVPGSLDEYYQEVGRAGRDGEPSEAVLFYRPEDLGLRRFFASGVLKRDELVGVARLRAGGVGEEEMRERTGFGPRKLPRLLSALEEAAEQQPDAGPEELADAAVAASEAQQRLERSRVEMVRGYAETAGCRRQFVLGYFGEEAPGPCGNCDNCLSGSSASVEGEVPEDAPYALQGTVAHPSFGTGVVMRYEDDRVVVLFETEGYKVLGLDAVESHGLLEAVEEAG
ncbi:ATP-dependent DNA helicase RecQ [Motilibacter rhizosphaerae]|uniref:ATP-dependent DNA helicase RecQ n=1 Tax=Motilibacter rhizosphaerae TaxID=598652 RepID=A0A4Q7NRY5_9ACTN|nr:ATP-dependent DNA helicase RecQ [Motilibacter rhizosphaerae]RZS89755.1 ATP-dependent DNA helicase RecQ [Motilibacter rhizosphaerae]